MSDGVYGIIGAGHLGRAIALRLLECGVPQDRVRLSHGGRPETLSRIEEAGLGSSVATNREIADGCGVVLLAVRPQAVGELARIPFASETALVSCLAGVSTGKLRFLLGRDVERMMPSGPDTILSGRGVAALYPGGGQAEALAGLLGLEAYPLSCEEDMNLFTAAVCVPAAIIEAGFLGLDPGAAIEALSAHYPGFTGVFRWAQAVVPEFPSAGEGRAFCDRMMTAGGITEAFVLGLRRSLSFEEAFREAVERSRAIAAAVRG
jgi:pyrroline-5-carboxylate reductase